MARRLSDDGNLGVHSPEPHAMTPTFTYSVMLNDGPASGAAPPSRSSVAGRSSAIQPRSSDTGGRLSSSGANDIFVRGSLLDRDIEVVAHAAEAKPERARDYKGRIRIWPGLIFLVLVLVAAAFGVTYYGIQAHTSSANRANKYEKSIFDATKIKGGSNNTKIVGKDIVDDDGVIGNPKKYPDSKCELPDYQSKNGHIVAVSKNGTEVSMKIKGINWFGMETGQALPFGLWDNSDNGTTAYQVASFLAENKFNAVRLPLMATWILTDKQPNTYIINKNENRAVNVTTYMSTLKSIVKVLQYRHIGVLLSMHTLTLKDNGKLWYNDDVPEEKFLESIDILTTNLCSSEYWNIMGIDLKNEPYAGTWGDGGAKDFRAASERIANRMLEGCPSWMGFVEGINAQHTLDIDGQEFGYYDWFGGGLHKAREFGLEFSSPNKVVWAPHYYTPAVFPQYYLFGGGNVVGNAIMGYVELDDDTLRHRIKVTMDDMFGFLASETGPALLLGEFGGLYSKDAHPMKTTKRCTDFTIEIIKQPGWAGGFVWSLNPESEYQYNPADTPGRYFEGMVQIDWLGANTEFLEGMAAMDDMDGLQPFPCFDTTGEAGSGSA